MEANVGTGPPTIRLSTRLRTPFARIALTARVRTKTTARTRAPTLYLSAERREKTSGLRGDARPDALACLSEEAGAHQAFDDSRGRFVGNLQGMTKSVYRDKGRAPVDDFFENGSHDLRTADRVATIYFHKASLRSRGWCRRLWDRYSSLVSIGHDSVQQVGEAQGEQINRLVHHVLAPRGAFLRCDYRSLLVQH
jgi:hypothetical protein